MMASTILRRVAIRPISNSVFSELNHLCGYLPLFCTLWHCDFNVYQNLTPNLFLCFYLAFPSTGRFSTKPNVIVPLIADSLEWALSSPPPLHQFNEPPCLVEVDHLKHLNPGANVEDVLKAQGVTITETEGLDAWTLEEYSDEKYAAWAKEQDAKWEKENETAPRM